MCMSYDYKCILSVTVFVCHDNGNIIISLICIINSPVLYARDNNKTPSYFFHCLALEHLHTFIV